MYILILVALVFWRDVGSVFVALETQSSLDHPDGVGQQESDEAGFGGGHHVPARPQRFIGRIVLLQLRFDCFETVICFVCMLWNWQFVFESK